MLTHICAGFDPILYCWFYSTHNDARYPSVATVFYPLHPLYGRGELPVSRRLGILSVQHVEVEADERRQAVPVWMTDEQLCRRLTTGLDCRCSLASLLELISLLRSTGL